MFSKLRNLFQSTVSVRLTAWYSGFFVLSLLTVFCFVYFTLSSSLRKNDVELLRAKLKEFADEYTEGGLDEIRKVSNDKLVHTFFVRVADARNYTALSSTPHDAE